MAERTFVGRWWQRVVFLVLGSQLPDLRAIALGIMRDTERANHPASGKAVIAHRLTIEHSCPGLPKPGHWARSVL